MSNTFAAGAKRWCQWAVGTACLFGWASWAAAQGVGTAKPTALTPVGLSDDLQRTEQRVRLPEVKVQGTDGRMRSFAQAVNDGRPVVLTFMFSSCNTVCPVNNQVMVEFERRLGSRRKDVNVMFVSIDPSFDSVQALKHYAQKTGASGTYYTGDPGGSEAIQRAFDAWRGDKMNHQPAFFIRGHAHAAWVRLDGLVTPVQLQREFERVAPSL